MSFPRYDSYKDSGVEWLGEVPEHWEIYEGKRIFGNRRELALADDEQLAASQKYGVIPQTLMMELNDSKVMLALKGTDSFRHVEKNDFVISLRSFEGGIEHSSYVGCVSPAYTVLKSTRQVTSVFFRHLFKSGAYVSALQATTDSLRDGKSITFQQFGNIHLAIPTSQEQQAIAFFLDQETSKIDNLISEQERLIALLKEKRQTVISHAVTKGLNPDVPMKDSGVEWLGEVPVGWVITKAKFVSNIFVPQRNKPELNDDCGVAWATMEDMKGNYIESTNHFVDSASAEMAGSKVLKAGAVIASCVGSFDVVSINQIDVIINQQLQAFIPFSIEAQYLRELIRISKCYFELVGTAATLIYVNQQGFENLPVLVPSIKEQQAIIFYLDQETTKIDNLIAESSNVISLLKERRSALISSAVTGKIDVRKFVPSQPKVEAMA
jgi:type I restriction enzyme S subunit